MSEKTSLSLSMTAANGDKMTKAVTDVNPAAENSALNAFAQGLAALTTNTLNTVSKISKQELSGTYTPITFTVDSNADNTSVVPTKVDDFHYTIPHANLHATGVPTLNYTGDSDIGIYWGSISLNISPKLDVKPYVVMNKSETQYIWVYADPITSVSNPHIEVGILTDADNTSGLVGVEFDVIVPAGQSGSTNWDSYTINFKIV